MLSETRPPHSTVEGLCIFETRRSTLSNASGRALDLSQYECVKPVHQCHDSQQPHRAMRVIHAPRDFYGGEDFYSLCTEGNDCLTQSNEVIENNIRSVIEKQPFLKSEYEHILHPIIKGHNFTNQRDNFCKLAYDLKFYSDDTTISEEEKRTQITDRVIEMDKLVNPQQGTGVVLFFSDKKKRKHQNQKTKEGK